MKLQDVRRDYSGDLLPEDLADFEPWRFFEAWLRQAMAQEVEANAMLLGTVDGAGIPRSRAVLLKDYSPRGLVFYTSHLSAKSRELDAHPWASATFWWPNSSRQVRAVGQAYRLERPQVEAYFATRPRGSQIGAWASHQSQPLGSRADLETARAEAERRFADGDVPCPPYWGGFVIDVTEFEFWQGQSGRSHDRVAARLIGDIWEAQRLQP